MEQQKFEKNARCGITDQLYKLYHKILPDSLTVYGHFEIEGFLDEKIAKRAYYFMQKRYYTMQMHTITEEGDYAYLDNSRYKSLTEKEKFERVPFSYRLEQNKNADTWRKVITDQSKAKDMEKSGYLNKMVLLASKEQNSTDIILMWIHAAGDSRSQIYAITEFLKYYTELEKSENITEAIPPSFEVEELPPCELDLMPDFNPPNPPVSGVKIFPFQWDQQVEKNKLELDVVYKTVPKDKLAALKEKTKAKGLTINTVLGVAVAEAAISSNVTGWEKLTDEEKDKPVEIPNFFAICNRRFAKLFKADKHVRSWVTPGMVALVYERKNSDIWAMAQAYHQQVVGQLAFCGEKGFLPRLQKNAEAAFFHDNINKFYIDENPNAPFLTNVGVADFPSEIGSLKVKDVDFAHASFGTFYTWVMAVTLNGALKLSFSYDQRTDPKTVEAFQKRFDENLEKFAQ